MRKFTSLMLMLLCAVTTWGAIGYSFGTAPVTTLTSGKYVLMAMCSHGTGPVYYNAAEGGNRLYRLHNGATFNAGDEVNANYVWTLTLNDDGTFTLENVEDGKFFVKDADKNKNFQGTETAVLAAEEHTINEIQYFALHLANETDKANIGYIHANAPGGNPNLSYWNAYGDDGTCIKFLFYPVTEIEVTVDFTPLTEAIAAANTKLADAGYTFAMGENIPLQLENEGQAGYLSVSHQAIDGDVLANAIDKNPSTLYHSDWGTSDKNHYIQIDLGETVDAFALNYTTRQSGNNAAPFAITIWGSNDGQNFATITELSRYDVINTIPASNGKEYTGIFAADEAYRYLRFNVTSSPNGNNSFGLAEISINKVSLTGEQSGVKMRYATIYKAILDATTVAENANAKESDVNDMATYLNKVVSVATAPVCPFELTTDINNPKCYHIKSARSMSENGQWGTPSYWQYKNSGDKIHKFTIEKYNTDEAAVQDINAYWFFMEDKNTGLIRLYPYSNAVAMGYTTVSDGAEKMTNNQGSDNFVGNTYQLVTKETGNYASYPYALQPYGYNTYVSNHGGYGQLMGFYNDLEDGGTRFTLIEAVTPSKKLASLSAVIKMAETCTAGENIGDYSAENIATLAELIAAAKNVASDLTSSDEACQAQIDALNNAMANNIILPTTGYYTISSASSNTYCQNAIVYAISTSVKRSESVIYNHNTLIYGKDIEVTPASVFKFIETENANEFKIQNVHTGEFVKSFGSDADQMGDENEARNVKISRIAQGQITLTIEGEYPMHAQEQNTVIVSWSAEPGNASTWTLNEVDPTVLSHTLTVGEVGYSTLMLGFDAEIPTGVECYYATEAIDENGVLNLTKIKTGILPANTAVVVKAVAKDYEFAYTDATATVEGNLLSGTLYTKNVTPAGTAYVLSAPEGAVGLYKATLTDGAFQNNANKAYLVVDGADTAASYSFNFDWAGTTGIEGVVAEGAENGAIYDITGRRVKAITAPGIYIVNGRKVVK